MVAALAAREALLDACGVRVGVKWPNDLVVGQRKIGGLLTEVVGSMAIVGIGINVAWSEDALPTAEATSVLVEGGRTDREELLARVLVNLEELRARWRAEDTGLLDEFRSACLTLGREVIVRLPGGASVSGTASGVDDDGHLIVMDGATPVSVSAGDVIHATITSWDTPQSSSPPVK
jgi:BirA family biotin operon repressor/biotin-[acetyl-CoA-carboxylase] ligase